MSDIVVHENVRYRRKDAIRLGIITEGDKKAGDEVAKKVVEPEVTKVREPETVKRGRARQTESTEK